MLRLSDIVVGRKRFYNLSRGLRISAKERIIAKNESPCFAYLNIIKMFTRHSYTQIVHNVTLE